MFLTPEYADIKRARVEFRKYATEKEISSDDEYYLEIVIGEVVANIIEHGMNVKKSNSIEFIIELDDRDVYFEFLYHGTKVTDEEVERYTKLEEKEDIEELSEHGRGIYIVHSIMDKVEYIDTGEKIIIKMKKKVKKTADI